MRNNYDKGANGVFKPQRAHDDRTHRRRRTIDYEFGELDELTHSYAMSIHRSQGSQYPCMVIPITMSAWVMPQHNLPSTAISRAKKVGPTD
jgi:exodeoxyribonuclease V alpha subunit